ncbi:MAG: serine hydrolase domain-containing protein [Pseudohongiellaceae bacterium]|nr:serine hydrolase domain-containing protein [Pseudohongiellaceae bacterium]
MNAIKIKFQSSILALGLLLSCAAQAQHGERNLAKVAPEDVGMSSAGIQAYVDTMHAEVDNGNIAGVVSRISRHGKTVLEDAYGYLDLENQVPMTDDAIFRIKSMTKPVAGVALMILLEEGKFTLDDPVEMHIPQFANLKVAKEDGPNGQPIVEEQDHKMTVRELMSHSGGLTYGRFSRSQVDSLYLEADLLNLDSTLEDMINKLAEIPLRQQPGSRWHYSVSVDVQGYLVEVLSGQKFDDFLQERIFGPLQMDDTGFYVGRENAARFSREYSQSADGLTSPENDSYIDPVNFLSGGGGLMSTAGDYLRFAQMLANGGELDGVRILSEDSVKQMHTNQLPPNTPGLESYPGNVFA